MNTGHAEHTRLICLFTAGFSLVLLFASLTSAQTTPPITSSGLNTTITQTANTYNITGGTRPGGGTNLYHSFGNFNVPNNNIANFLNETALPTNNILGRVTGGNISNIFGTIQTTGFGNANLFLMNPSGFLFGPNATVNVGGMVSFTTADYLRLTDNARFNAIPGPADALLTAAPVAAFGFLGSNPGAITVQGSQLTVTPGISLVGGDIKIQSGTLDNGTVQSAKLSAPGGQINLASVASPGEILAGTLAQAPNINGQSFGNLGSVQISEQSIIDVSGQTGGKISIRSGQFQIDNATLQSNTVLGDSGGIEIASSVMNMNGGSIQTSTAGPGIAGNIAVDARTLTMSDGAFMASNLLGAGNGGNIRVNATESMSISGLRPGITFVGPVPFTNLPSGLYTQTFSAARGGNIDATTPQLHLQGGFLQTYTFGPGRAGDVVTTVSTLDLSEGSRVTSNTFGTGNGGNVTLTATDSIYMVGHFPGIFGVGSATSMNFPTQIGTTTFGPGRAGDVMMTVGRLDVTEGSRLTSTTLGTGDGGNVTLRATDSIHVVGQHPGIFQSSAGGSTATNIPSEVSTNTGGAGKGGQLTVSAPVLDLQTGLMAAASTGTGQAGTVTVDVGELSVTKGAVIHSSSFGTGAGGNVSVSATDILVSGRSGVTYSNGPIVFDDIQSAIASATFGPGPSGNVTLSARNLVISHEGKIEASTGGNGAAGKISISVENATLTTGGKITSSSGLIVGPGVRIGNGQGGEINLQATDTLAASGQGSGLFTSTVAGGNGGAMNVQVAQLDLRDGAVLSASTIGSGKAGTVTVQGLASPAQSILIDGVGSGIFTNTSGSGAGGNTTVSAQSLNIQNGGAISAATSGPAPSATGGNITINADQVQVNSGGLITAATSGAGAGGSVNINAGTNFSSDAGTVSSTAAQATGGNVNVAAGQSVTLTNGATISASSTGQGNAGSIQINAGNQLAMANSTVTTEANQSGGGTIKITTTPSGTVELTNSKISASVLDGNGGGGSVNIDPQFVILQNSQILAQAVQGPGGSISITTNLLLPDSLSVISASSQFGTQGTVSVQSPISPAGGKIIPLGQKPLIPATLFGQRCAAIAEGSFSSFTVAGRDSLPAEPVGWISSPLALSLSESGDGTATEAAPRTSSSEVAEDIPLLSLRQIAPPGFLTQSFAVDWSDCQS